MMETPTQSVPPEPQVNNRVVQRRVRGLVFAFAVIASTVVVRSLPESQRTFAPLTAGSPRIVSALNDAAHRSNSLLALDRSTSQSPPLHLDLVDAIGGASSALAVGDGVVFRAVGTRVEVYDAGLPGFSPGDYAEPTRLGSSAILPGTITGLARRGRTLFASYTVRTSLDGPSGGLVVLDAADVTLPVEIGRLELGLAARDVSLLGDTALVVGDAGMRSAGWIAPSGALYTVNVIDPARPRELAMLSLDYGAGAVTTAADDAFADRAFLVEDDGGLDTFSVRAIDLTDPGAPTFGERRSLPGEPRDILLVGSKLYAAGGSGGVFQFTPTGVSLGIPNPAIDVPRAKPCTAALAASADGRWLAVGDACDEGVRTFEIAGAPRLTSRGRAVLAEPASAMVWHGADVWSGTGHHGGMGVVDASNPVRPARRAERFGFGAPSQVEIHEGWAVGVIPGAGLSAKWVSPWWDEPREGARAALHRARLRGIKAIDREGGVLFASMDADFEIGIVTKFEVSATGVNFESAESSFTLEPPAGDLALDGEIGVAKTAIGELFRFRSEFEHRPKSLSLDGVEDVLSFDADSRRIAVVDSDGVLSIHGPIDDLDDDPGRIGALPLGLNIANGIGIAADAGVAYVHEFPAGAPESPSESPLVRVSIDGSAPEESARWVLPRAPWRARPVDDVVLVGDDRSVRILDGDPASVEMRTLFVHDLPGQAYDVAMEGGLRDAVGRRVVVAAGDAGLFLFRLVALDLPSPTPTPTRTPTITPEPTSTGGTDIPTRVMTSGTPVATPSTPDTPGGGRIFLANVMNSGSR